MTSIRKRLEAALKVEYSKERDWVDKFMNEEFEKLVMRNKSEHTLIIHIPAELKFIAVRQRLQKKLTNEGFPDSYFKPHTYHPSCGGTVTIDW